MIHHVFANRSNIGDWLAAKGIQRLLHPLPVTEHLCDADFVPDTLRRLGRLGPDDLVVIGGGGLFMDYFAPFWQGIAERSGDLRYCLWGVGYCDLKAEPSHPPQQMLRQVVARSALCVVRDELTRGHLGAAGQPPPVPCPSLAAIEPAAPGWGLLHVDNYTTVGPGAFEVMDQAGRRFAAATARPYRRTNNRIEPGSEHGLAHCLALYAQSDLVVSSALHGCIVAVAMGRPVLAVSGDRKIEAFMQAAGLGDWVLDHADLAPLGQRLEALPGQRQAQAFVEHARTQNRQVAAKVAALSGAARRAGGWS